MNTESNDQNFDFEDFQEAPRIPRANGYHPIVLGVGGALLGLILAVVFIGGSLPEMTPKQIVAMEGYEGEQPPRHIFNLDSLAGSNPALNTQVVNTQGANTQGVIRQSQSNQPQSHQVDSSQEQSNLTPVVASDDTRAGANRTGSNSSQIAALLAIETEEPKDSWSLEIVEVPASPIIVGKDAQEVAAPIVEEFDYRKLNRRRAVPELQSDTSVRMAVDTTEQDEVSKTIRVLPVLTVNTDNTYIRAEPAQSADVKLVLARGASVTAFEQAGVWVHVGANDGSSITGYVHQSKIAVTEIN